MKDLKLFRILVILRGLSALFWEVIILFLFLVNILPPFFLIYLFNERFEIVENTGYIKGSFYCFLEYHLFINPSLVSLCYASTG